MLNFGYCHINGTGLVKAKFGLGSPKFKAKTIAVFEFANETILLSNLAQVRLRNWLFPKMGREKNAQILSNDSHNDLLQLILIVLISEGDSPGSVNRFD
jgi:hypothetical protein